MDTVVQDTCIATFRGIKLLPGGHTVFPRAWLAPAKLTRAKDGSPEEKIMSV
jgi:hypothetical protein